MCVGSGFLVFFFSVCLFVCFICLCVCVALFPVCFVVVVVVVSFTRLLQETNQSILCEESKISL